MLPDTIDRPGRRTRADGASERSPGQGGHPCRRQAGSDRLGKGGNPVLSLPRKSGRDGRNDQRTAETHGE